MSYPIRYRCGKSGCTIALRRKVYLCHQNTLICSWEECGTVGREGARGGKGKKTQDTLYHSEKLILFENVKAFLM